MWYKHGESINCLFFPNIQCWWLTSGVAWGALGPGCVLGGHEQSQASAKWLRLWTQGSSLETEGAEKLTSMAGTSLFPQKNPSRNMPRGCVWAPVKDLPYSTAALRRVTTARVSKWGMNLPFLLSRQFSLGSWGNREGRSQFLLFCLDVSLHPSLEGVASTRCKSLSIPVRVCCRRTSACPKLHLAAGRPQCPASSARITNQRATETGPKHRAAPVLIECLR